MITGWGLESMICSLRLIFFAILSRSFCNTEEIKDIATIETVFAENMVRLREYEKMLAEQTSDKYEANKQEVQKCVEKIVEMIKERNAQ